MERTPSALSTETVVMRTSEAGTSKHSVLQYSKLLWIAALSALLGSYQFGEFCCKHSLLLLPSPAE